MQLEHALRTLATVERTPIASRVLLSAGYDPATQTLELEFASGRLYRFDGVPPGTYEWLLRSPNKGGYIARMINNRYRHQEITPAPPPATQDLAAALRASLRDLQAPDTNS